MDLLETRMDNDPVRSAYGEKTALEHIINYDYTNFSKYLNKNKIICTISHASREPEVLQQMLHAGMRVARMNLSYYTHEFHEESIRRVREAAQQFSKEVGYNVDVAIAIDLRGAEVRSGSLEGKEDVQLVENRTIELTTNGEFKTKGTAECVFVDCPHILETVPVNSFVYIDRGKIQLRVLEITEDALLCKIISGGILGPQKLVIFPKIDLRLPDVSERDRYDLKFAAAQKVDFIFASRIRNAETIREIRDILVEGGQNIKIISKIETKAAMLCLQKILDNSDGLLLPRVDLSFEVGFLKAVLCQKEIFRRCKMQGKPVICATEIFESMTKFDKPTIAEVNSLVQMLLDGADCVMLSTETVNGKHPIETIKMVDLTCRQAEGLMFPRVSKYETAFRTTFNEDVTEAGVLAAVAAARSTLAVAIIIFTASGRTARLLSSYRPECPVIALTRCSRTARQLQVHSGLYPVFYPEAKETLEEDVEARLNNALNAGHKLKIINSGDLIVLLTSEEDGEGYHNNIQVLNAYFEEVPLYCRLEAEKEAFRNVLQKTL